MLGMTVQNFLSAASGIAVLLAVIRGLTRKSASKLGNYWVDLVRSVMILLPLAIILSIILVWQGDPQTFSSAINANLLEPFQTATQTIMTQTIQVGPVASQVAIKLLGSNGGGFFNANSAHPFENPTAFSNFIECLAMLIVPASLCITFGYFVEDRHEGYAIFWTMFILFVGFLGLTMWAEMQVPSFLNLPSINASMGNMEGKEVRFGPVMSSLFATITTATSNGSVNAMMESFTPLGSIGPLLLMQIGEITFGGVGCGLYGMLVFVMIANFIAGLMVGRTPEYLGKKLGPTEMKLITIIIIIPIVTILIGSVIAVLSPLGIASISASGPHGFTEVIYAFTSAVANNGSAFAGLNGNTLFYNYALGIAMLIGRYAVAFLTIQLAGALVVHKRVPHSLGTLRTYTPSS